MTALLSHLADDCDRRGCEAEQHGFCGARRRRLSTMLPEGRRRSRAVEQGAERGRRTVRADRCHAPGASDRLVHERRRGHRAPAGRTQRLSRAAVARWRRTHHPRRLRPRRDRRHRPPPRAARSAPSPSRRALIDQHARARGGEPDAAILFSVAFAEDGAEVFAQACALGCEGIVSTRVGSIYRPGNSAGEWVKTLKPGCVRAPTPNGRGRPQP